MTQVIHLHMNQIPAHLRGGYSGRKFKAYPVESIKIPATAGLWEGGSRDMYHAIDLATGERCDMPGQNSAPLNTARVERHVALVPGYAVVRESVFCGKDGGLTFYVHPVNVTALIPDQSGEALTPNESRVVVIISSLISRARRDEAMRAGINPVAYADILVSLKAKGMMTAQGGLTVAGKNAAAAVKGY